MWTTGEGQGLITVTAAPKILESPTVLSLDVSALLRPPRFQEGHRVGSPHAPREIQCR